MYRRLCSLLLDLRSSYHRLGDYLAYLLRRLDEVGICDVSVARRRAVPSMPEQLADQGQILARQAILAGCRVAQVMQAQPAELRIRADRPPANNKVPPLFQLRG